MEQLFIIRHGDYNKVGGLTILGKSQINQVATQIKKYCDGKRVVILTSTAPRALESTKIIAEINQIEKIIRNQFLWSGDDADPINSYYYNQNPSKIMDILDSDNLMENDIVIIVSHYEVVNQLPSFFFKVMLGQTQFCPNLKEGECLQIDIANKSFKLLKGINTNPTELHLDLKLGLLHNCLTIQGIPENIPNELIDYSGDFEIFKESIKDCLDSQEKTYIQALSIFRDKLLK